jgi:hypothetical protein
MFSNIADSSNAGFVLAASTNSSAFVLISANFRNHWILSRISFLLRSMASRVSISSAQRFWVPWTGVCLPKTSCPSRPDRLWTGLVS